MTDERRKYLASISKEERVIRTEIYKHQEFIKSVKEMLDDIDDCAIASSFKTDIAEEKLIIKSLKKQLPAPTQLNNIYKIYSCPICDWLSGYQKYCPYCGQILR